MKLDVEKSAPAGDTLNMGPGSASTGQGTASEPVEPSQLAAVESPTAFTDGVPGAPVEPVDQPDADAPVETEPGTTDAMEPGATEAVEPAPLDKAPLQTLAGRVWIGLIAGAILLVLLIIFVAENTKSVSINFLGAHGHISLGLALLIAIVAGIAITLMVGSARIVQLSLEVRRHRRKLNKLT